MDAGTINLEIPPEKIADGLRRWKAPSSALYNRRVREVLCAGGVGFGRRGDIEVLSLGRLTHAMNILFIGDIFSSAGRRIVADHLADIKETQRIDLVIANAENAAGGFGITPTVAEELFGMRLDVMTTGNHIWDKQEIYDYFARRPALLRPANYRRRRPGAGVIVVKARNGADCAVINLQGRTTCRNRLPVPQSR